MKILQLLPELNEGGIERGVVELNREMVRVGVSSHVISKGGKLTDQIVADGGQHNSLNICDKNLFTFPQRVRQLRTLIQQIQPDVIHARSRYPAWIAWFANRKLRVPFVTTVHGMNSINAYSRIMARGERVICVSEVIEQYIQEAYPVDPKRLRVVQRGADLELFAPDQIDTDFIDGFLNQHQLHNRFVVSSVGRITWLKDYETFIKAIARCSEQIPNITGLIVGGVREDKTDYLESLKKLARDQGIEQRIVFAGNQNHMPEIYLLSDILVNASLKMGNVGRTVVESLAMNTPVLATTFKGLDNVIVDGRNGYLIKNQDTDDLKDKIQRLHANPISDTRSSIPRAFTLTAMVEDTLEIYQELLREKGLEV